MIPLPEQKYSCLVIDPPWFYELRKDDKTHRNRIPYPPMQIEEILALPVPELLEKNAIVWLWFTNNHAPEAIDCLRAWGLELKTILTWEKVTKAGTPHIGVGHWLRNCTEHCALATKGSPSSFKHLGTLTNQPTILHSPRREHSRKPEEFYQLVDRLCSGSKLEMFARCRREGWDCWGDEVDKFTEVQIKMRHTLTEIEAKERLAREEIKKRFRARPRSEQERLKAFHLLGSMIRSNPQVILLMEELARRHKQAWGAIATAIATQRIQIRLDSEIGYFAMDGKDPIYVEDIMKHSDILTQQYLERRHAFQKMLNAGSWTETYFEERNQILFAHHCISLDKLGFLCVLPEHRQQIVAEAWREYGE